MIFLCSLERLPGDGKEDDSYIESERNAPYNLSFLKHFIIISFQRLELYFKISESAFIRII